MNMVRDVKTHKVFVILYQLNLGTFSRIGQRKIDLLYLCLEKYFKN